MRISIGIAAMLIVAMAFGSILGLLATASSTFDATPQFGTALLGFVAASLGGFIARRAFFAPIAVAAYSTQWALAIYHVHKFPLGLTYADLVLSNVVPIFVSLTGVGLGALLGHYLSRTGQDRSAAA